jgi:putative ABC transport system permease protein
LALARSNSRPMFWRIVRRLIAANRGRLIVILLALGAGAAVTAALLNLQIDAKKRLTTEFRAFGANVIVAPQKSGVGANETLDESVARRAIAIGRERHVAVLPVLYITASAVASSSSKTVELVVAGGARGVSDAAISGNPEGYKWWGVSENTAQPVCFVGARVAAHLNIVKDGDPVTLRSEDRVDECRVGLMHPVGGPEDDQVATTLELAQLLAAMPGRVSLVQISVPGTSGNVQDFVSDLQKQIPEADVHGIRQFTEAEGKIYERISGLLAATVAVVLVLTTLCVMAAMTNVAMERKNDVGLMKAIGGATRRVLRLFLAEAATLGLIAGLIGAAVGLALSVALGKAVFGVAAQPRFIVYPVVVALTIAVAVAGAYPLRRLAGIRPASVFRGEA